MQVVFAVLDDHILMIGRQALDEIAPAFDRIDGVDYICYGTHEQYFFPDYFAYQPDTKAKFHAAAEWIAGHGYEYVFIEDTVA